MCGASDGGKQDRTVTECIAESSWELPSKCVTRHQLGSSPSDWCREINTIDIRSAGISMTLAQLADHFHQRELGSSNGRISYSTKKAYQGYLNKWIVPRWGDRLLPNIKAVEVELWLKTLERAAGTCCKIRNVMSVLLNHARRYDLY